MLTHTVLISRILVGAALGGVIGFERDRHGRHVGLRTHLIVAMTSATFMVLSAHFMFYQNYTDRVEVDASRIAASVVSGIGFLAGGAILRTGANVQGLTTAAGLWLVTAIGMCAGAGMFQEAVAVTMLGYIALGFLRRFEDKNDKLIRRRVSLVLEEGSATIPNIMEMMSSYGAVVSDFDYEKKVDDHQVAVSFEVRIPAVMGVSKLIEDLEGQPGLHRVHVGLKS